MPQRVVLTALVVMAAIAAASAQDDAARRQLTPTGTLRIGINTGNQVTRIVGPELGRELGRRLGVEAVIVEYDTPGAAGDAVGKGWDIAFIAADPDREAAIAFTPAYLEMDATYLVRGDSPFTRAADVDASGVRIATGVTSAYTLFLRRELQRAQLVLMSNNEAASALRERTVDAIAGTRVALGQTAPGIPGSRVLPDNFTLVQQAIAVPRANTAAMAYLTTFVANAVRSGFIASAIQRTGVTGVSVPQALATPTEHIRRTMPQDRPGSLTRQQTADVLAYMLKLGMFPSGQLALDPSADNLARIRFATSAP